MPKIVSFGCMHNIDLLEKFFFNLCHTFEVRAGLDRTG